MTYWQKRIRKLTNKTISELEDELKILYYDLSDKMLTYMIQTVSKIVKGDKVSISELYKFDRYYELIGEIERELTDIGNKEIDLLTTDLTKYEQLIKTEIDSSIDFTQVLDTEGAKTVVDKVWATDGKNFSDRVWEDKAKLTLELSKGLIDIVAVGGSMAEAVQKLTPLVKSKVKNAEYVAKRLIRTETAYIQNQTAIDRYKLAGIKEFRYNTVGDKIVCEECKILDQKVFPIESAKIGVNVPPNHPFAGATLLRLLETRVM